MLIVGLDLSLTSTGVARIWDAPDGSPAVHLTRVESKAPARPKGSPPPSLGSRSTRLRKLAATIVGHCVAADLVVVEAPAYSRNMGSAHDRAGLWWLVVARLTGGGLNVVEVEPTTLKVYATGAGNRDKDKVLAAVIRRYQHLIEVDGNDTADALVLAAMGRRFAGRPIEPELPQTHVRAMLAPKWAPNH